MLIALHFYYDPFWVPLFIKWGFCGRLCFHMDIQLIQHCLLKKCWISTQSSQQPRQKSAHHTGMELFLPITHSLITVALQGGEVGSLTLIFLSKFAFDCSSFFVFSLKFWNQEPGTCTTRHKHLPDKYKILSLIPDSKNFSGISAHKRSYWSSGWLAGHYIDQFGKNWHLEAIECFSQWCSVSFHLFSS